MESNLVIITMPNIKRFGKLVENQIKLIRNTDEVLSADVDIIRFSNGEGKASLKGNVRGKKIVILCDVGNYGEASEYISRGKTYMVGPDGHVQDLKRVISALNGEADEIRVITPLLPYSRQDKNSDDAMESLDCRDNLKSLEYMGVKGITTFDAHNPTACINALGNTTSFDNLYPTYSILKRFIDNEDINPDSLTVVAPDAGALGRARYYADNLGADIGHFIKRRDTRKVVEGKNPIVEHKYLGDSVEGKDVIVVDDMIASGGSILDAAKKLKEKGARKIYLIATFPLFSDGYKSVQAFDEAYKNGYFDKLYTTNITYVPEYIRRRKWFFEADCSRYLAKYIDAVDKGNDLTSLKDAKAKIAGKLKEKVYTLNK